MVAVVIASSCFENTIIKLDDLIIIIMIFAEGVNPIVKVDNEAEA